MKNLFLISFVGVDNNTSLKEIFNFQSDTLCEFSVLFSESKSLTKDKRYPDLDFCNQFLTDTKSKGILGSIHLCGSVIDRYLSEDTQIIDLCKNAYRIQLNLNIGKYNDYDHLACNIMTVSQHNNHSVILQQNKTKSEFMNVFLKKYDSSSFLQETVRPINILHDSSGGFGREISKVESPHNLYLTGYAGGLGPENVVKIVNLIESANPNGYPYYIDMESKIREDNYFSLEKCSKVVQNLNQM